MSDDAELAPVKAKRKKTMSPTARTLAECRKRGWHAGVVEQTIPKMFIKRDLFNVIDIVAITGAGEGSILAIQTTGDNAGDMSKRKRKILAEPRALAWLNAGGRLEVWGWGKRGAHDTRKLWTLRIEVITREMFVLAIPADAPEAEEADAA